MEIDKCDQPGFDNEDEKLNQDVREIEKGMKEAEKSALKTLKINGLNHWLEYRNTPFCQVQ